MLRETESPMHSSDGSGIAVMSREAWSLRVKVPPRRCLRRKFFNFFHIEESAVITASTRR